MQMIDRHFDVDLGICKPKKLHEIIETFFASVMIGLKVMPGYLSVS